MGRTSQKFDRHLFTLKLSELSREMQEKSVAADRKAVAASQKTGGSSSVNRVDGQLALLREWLKGVDRICREVWQIQGETITPDFVRDVLVSEAMTLIGAREGTIKYIVSSAAQRTRGDHPAHLLGHLARESERLRGVVNTRYEIEVRELEYQKSPAAQKSGPQSQLNELGSIRGLIEDATRDTKLWFQADASAEERAHVLAMQEGLASLARIVEHGMERRKETKDEWEYSETVSEVLSLLDKAREVRGSIVGKGLARLAACLPRELFGSKVHPVTPSASPTWRGFQNRFMELAREEQGRADVITKGKVLQRIERVLRASCSYREHPEGWERGKPNQGMICLLHTPPHGVWNYASDGISENFFERVRLCVAEAGRALPDYPRGTDPEDFWLHQLYLDLLKNNSDSLFCASNEGGMILSVCVASATFCARLERKSLEQSEPSKHNAPTEQHKKRLTATVSCPNAARKMEEYLKSKGIGQTQFAVQVGTTDRTLRSFRQTGKVRRDILESIAKQMGTTKETLLKE